VGLAVKVRFTVPDTVKVLVLLREGAVGVLEGVKVSVSGTDSVVEWEVVGVRVGGVRVCVLLGGVPLGVAETEREVDKEVLIVLL